MAKRQSGKNAKLQEEIRQLRARQRYDLLKMAIAIVAVIALILLDANYNLAIAEINESLAMAKSVGLWVAAVVLAAFAGFAGRDYSRCGKSISEIQRRLYRK